VAGVSFDLGEENVHGFVWSDGTTTDLGSLAPCGINDAGSVAGFRSLSTAAIALADRAALWQGGMVTDLATLGGQFGYATAISNWGQIVGWSFNATHAAPRATLWLNGVVYDLGTLGGAASQAYDVASDAGYVVGVADTAQAKPHAFRLRINAAGTVTSRVDLGELSGGASYAYGVNNNGDVVGTSDSRAFLWRGGAMVDLNTQIPAGAGWTLETARAISDGGRIAGTGRHLGAERAYLLAAVGDIDGDGDVDLGDYGRFSACLGGPGVTVPPLPCTAMDFLVCDVDADGDVDLGDYAAVAAAF
jgi:probable HAF family extracellular repeat protein